MKIIVEKKAITNAAKKDSHHCMIADTLHDMGYQYVSVDTQTIRFSDPTDSKKYVYLTPPKAQQEILRWDRGIMVQPFAFHLDRPIKVEPRQTKWQGKKEVKLKAQRKYDKKRRDPMAVRLVKKNKKNSKVSRFREFGIKKWTKTNEATN